MSWRAPGAAHEHLVREATLASRTLGVDPLRSVARVASPTLCCLPSEQPMRFVLGVMPADSRPELRVSANLAGDFKPAVQRDVPVFECRLQLASRSAGERSVVESRLQRQLGVVMTAGKTRHEFELLG